MSETIKTPLHYNTKIEVVYTNNREYRACLRNVFRMETRNVSRMEYYDSSLNKTVDGFEPASPPVVDQDADIIIDEETADEWDYDDASTMESMDTVYQYTKDHPLLAPLYLAAAGVMFSQDPEIGLCVLFSYDSFALFHQCIVCYTEFPDLFDEHNRCFQELQKRFVR